MSECLILIQQFALFTKLIILLTYSEQTDRVNDFGGDTTEWISIRDEVGSTGPP